MTIVEALKNARYGQSISRKCVGWFWIRVGNMNSMTLTEEDLLADDWYV